MDLFFPFRCVLSAISGVPPSGFDSPIVGVALDVNIVDNMRHIVGGAIYETTCDEMAGFHGINS